MDFLQGFEEVEEETLLDPLKKILTDEGEIIVSKSLYSRFGDLEEASLDKKEIPNILNQYKNCLNFNDLYYTIFGKKYFLL